MEAVALVLEAGGVGVAGVGQMVDQLQGGKRSRISPASVLMDGSWVEGR